MKRQSTGFAMLSIAMLSAPVMGASRISAEVDAIYPQTEALYIDLHRHPDLSFHEEPTARKLAAGLREAGFEVTTGVGKTGVVGVLKNGNGPVVLLRTDLDGLPVEEKTGLPFASTARTKDDGGADVGLMHACGHDIHMSSWMATARVLANSRKTWSGTLVLIGQPAEEVGAGASAMLSDGLLTRFPRPDFALAIHDDARLPAGVIGYHAGPILSNADTLRITIYGAGGHGARPETTVDPVVIAARTVMSLQTIVSREISPFDSAVVTVGAIHGGTKANIVPAEVRLDLTVRSLTIPIREKLLKSIERIARAEAAAAGAPREPLIEKTSGPFAMVNDPDLTERVAAALTRAFSPDVVRDAAPEMASEDFSEFQRAGIPSLMLRIGAVEQAKFDAAEKSGAALPSLHSPFFAPDREKTIKASVAAEVLSLRELMPAGAAPAVQ